MGTGQALSLVLTEEFLPCSYDAPNLDRDVSPVLFKRYSLELPFSAMASLTQESNNLSGWCVYCEALVGCSFREFLELATSVL